METLFTLDALNYDPCWPRRCRPSVRAIVVRDGRLALVHAVRYDYYKFPGGGVEGGETPEEALCREVAEEAGLRVLPETIRPYGSAWRVERDGGEDRIFAQENVYYRCEVAEEPLARHLDAYEAAEGFTPCWVTPDAAIAANRRPVARPKSPLMIERETRILERLAREIGTGH